MAETLRTADTEVRVEAFLYELYNRILRWVQEQGMQRIAEFGPQRVDPWQSVGARELTTTDVGIDIEGAIVFTKPGLTFCCVLGRGYNGLVRYGEPLRVLFGGFYADSLRKNRSVVVEDLSWMTRHKLLAPDYLSGEFYGDGGRLHLNCWVDGWQYGGRRFSNDLDIEKPERFLNKDGFNACLTIVERTVRQGKR